VLGKGLSCSRYFACFRALERDVDSYYSLPLSADQNLCTKHIRNLLRAYNLLVATRDDERAIVGRVSRNWLQSEREDWLRLSDIPTGVFSTVRGREILCEALMPDLDVNPETANNPQ